MAQSNFILLGPPGAGKGTQAEEIIRVFGVAHISTGYMLLAARANGTEIGKLAAEYMDAGKLVPDEVVIGIVRERIAEPDCENGFLLDGFPRTIAQAEALGQMIAAAGLATPRVINLAVEDEELIRRLSGRRMCKGCGAIYHVSRDNLDSGDKCPACDGEIYQRSDDQAEAIRERLNVYKAQTEPLIAYYGNKGQLVAIDAAGAPAEVNERIMKALGH